MPLYQLRVRWKKLKWILWIVNWSFDRRALYFASIWNMLIPSQGSRLFGWKRVLIEVPFKLQRLFHIQQFLVSSVQVFQPSRDYENYVPTFLETLICLFAFFGLTIGMYFSAFNRILSPLISPNWLCECLIHRSPLPASICVGDKLIFHFRTWLEW